MVGAILKHHRLRQGLKQYWVAEQAAISVHTLVRLEQERTRGCHGKPLNPYWETVCRVATVLRLSLDDLWAEANVKVRQE
ncbi:MAG: helix-turn-helix domain-containing protein [Gammaproteobacteria bacterium]